MSHPAVGWGLPLASGGQRPGLLSGTLARTGRPQQSYADPGVGGEAERAARAAEGKRRGRPLGGTLALRGGPAAGSAAGCTRLCTSPRFYELQFSPDQNGDAAFCAGSFQDEKKNALLGRVLVPVSHVPGGAAGRAGRGGEAERGWPRGRTTRAGAVAVGRRVHRPQRAPCAHGEGGVRRYFCSAAAEISPRSQHVFPCHCVAKSERGPERAPGRPRLGRAAVTGGAQRLVIDSRGDIDSLCLGGK